MLKEWYSQMIIFALVEEIQVKTVPIISDSRKVYSFVINKHPKIIQQVPSIYTAQYLGMSREHLSRISHNIED